MLGARGDLYGTTSYASGGTQRNPHGTVFEMDTSGNEGPLYTFGSTSGEYPLAGIVQDAQGNLYGTTWEGGAYGKGTLFKLDTAGNETALYSFTGKIADGAHPRASLVLDAQGNVYGTTANGGGALACSGGVLGHGCGTVFKVDKTGNETVLHRFTKAGGGRRKSRRRFSAGTRMVTCMAPPLMAEILHAPWGLDVAAERFSK